MREIHRPVVDAVVTATEAVADAIGAARGCSCQSATSAVARLEAADRQLLTAMWTVAFDDSRWTRLARPALVGVGRWRPRRLQRAPATSVGAALDIALRAVSHAKHHIHRYEAEPVTVTQATAWGWLYLGQAAYIVNAGADLSVRAVVPQPGIGVTAITDPLAAVTARVAVLVAGMTRYGMSPHTAIPAGLAAAAHHQLSVTLAALQPAIVPVGIDLHASADQSSILETIGEVRQLADNFCTHLQQLATTLREVPPAPDHSPAWRHAAAANISTAAHHLITASTRLRAWSVRL